MLDIHSEMIGPHREGPCRRDFLRTGAIGTLGLTLPDWFRRKAQANPAEAKAKAKSVIQLWMGGGPTHPETLDPKPEAGEEYTDPFKSPIETNVPGTRIGHLLPQLAKQADKYSILRSFNSMSSGHEVGTYIVQTGTMPWPEFSVSDFGFWPPDSVRLKRHLP